jgi:hypothetical protein
MLSGKYSMKSFFKIFFVLLFYKSHAQDLVSFHITKSKLPKLISVHGIIPNIPKDCMIKSYILSCSFNGAFKEFSCSNDTLGEKINKIIHGFYKGQHFFIEQLKSDCPKTHARSYKIIVD